MKKLIVFILVCSSLWLRGQAPGCPASYLFLHDVFPEGIGDIALLTVSEASPVDSFFLDYEYGANAEGQQIQGGVGPDFSQVLMQAHYLHWFTARNKCADGSWHTGSTIELWMDDPLMGYNCPIPANMQITFLSNALINFHWELDPTPDFWHIKYEPAGFPAQEFDVALPEVSQELIPGVIEHFFSIYAVCNFPGLNTELIEHSPTVRFKVVVVEDIKLLTIPCDTLRKAVRHAFQIRCSNPTHYNGGDYGPNKELFLFDHNCLTTGISADRHHPEEWFELASNPASDQLEIYLPAVITAEVRMTIWDIWGRRMVQSNYSIGTGFVVLDISGWPQGNYLIAIESGDQTGVQHFVIQ